MEPPDQALLVKMAHAVAESPGAGSLSARLCFACQTLSGVDAAAITVSYTASHRVTLCATNETAARLEDLQDLLGEGPGQAASRSGRAESCSVPGDSTTSRWSHFAEAALDLVQQATIYAIPMRPADRVLGVLTLYQLESVLTPPSLEPALLLKLAASTGAALIRDPSALDEDLDQGPWDSRAKIHQATGVVVAQLGVDPDDALAVLRAHAYAGGTTLADIAQQLLLRELNFSPDEQ